MPTIDSTHVRVFGRELGEIIRAALEREIDETTRGAIRQLSFDIGEAYGRCIRNEEFV